MKKPPSQPPPAPPHTLAIASEILAALVTKSPNFDQKSKQQLVNLSLELAYLLSQRYFQSYTDPQNYPVNVP